MRDDLSIASPLIVRRRRLHHFLSLSSSPIWEFVGVTSYDLRFRFLNFEYNQVIALPLLHKPLIHGFFMPIYVKDPKVLAALQESTRQQAPYAGAFLLKEYALTDSSSSSETENNLEKLKGKDLLNRIHNIGTLAQISSIQGEQVILIGCRRLQITEMVSEEPLTVKVDHLKDEPYDRDDDVIKTNMVKGVQEVKRLICRRFFWSKKQ